MNISEPFIRRPVATTLLTVAIALAGRGGVPAVCRCRRCRRWIFPTISVCGVAAGRESGNHGVVGGHAARTAVRPHRVGHRDDLVEHARARPASRCSSISNRNIDAAARDVQAAINAARGYLPANLPSNPTYRKVNPADSPIFMLGAHLRHA